ncbi:winged helix-turn-helix domain-containing protein [Mesorhizobium sp.]|uniref:winged helix-turn-helix domain-containing protein n=1 Tax=Mesorhizobium sp. TaxID=1871066 RepID=UPI000FE73BFA|nr:MAG: hypothetical protein EOR07_19910 [Mesorhizobium sp.]
MTAASRNTYCKWVENALRALGPSRPKVVYDWIRRHEPVPAADLSGSTTDGENLFEKNVRWARFQLRHEGVVSSPSRGVWALRSPSSPPSP